MEGSINSDQRMTAGTPTAAAACIRPPSDPMKARLTDKTAAACLKDGVVMFLTPDR
jgi:hypothetical protein